MVTMNELLIKAKDANASDVHITVGIPPKCRVNGELIDLGYPPFAPDDTARIIEQIMDEKQRERN